MRTRDHTKLRLQDGEFDVLVIGAGINGAAVASALAHRGLRTALVDARDFAGYTSQGSSNLIWGGIKYLENFELGLVRRLCRSRNTLMQAYPNAVKETRFLAAISRKASHTRLLVWLGAWLYWLLGDGKTRIPRLLSCHALKRTEPTINTAGIQGGVEYSDALLVDGDARFVFSLVHRAVDAGCVAANYLEVTDAQRFGKYWQVDIADRMDDSQMRVRARVVVNAAGPFADQIVKCAQVATGSRHVLSRGIHLVTHGLSRCSRVLAFIAKDGRPFFVIPLGHRASIGTTDTPVESPTVNVEESDRDFVLDNINACLDLDSPLDRADVISERCGVRPLAVAVQAKETGDFLSLSRKHVIETDTKNRFVSIFGGKLTDCLDVGAETRDAVLSLGLADPGVPSCWYGESDTETQNAFFARAQLFISQDARFDQAWCQRLWRYYGSRALQLIQRLADEPDAGEVILQADGVTRAELELVRDNEMVVMLEDFLRRRTLLAQTYLRTDLAGHAMLRVCEILFGERARQRYTEYFHTAPPEVKDHD